MLYTYIPKYIHTYIPTYRYLTFGVVNSTEGFSAAASAAARGSQWASALDPFLFVLGGRAVLAGSRDLVSRVTYIYIYTYVFIYLCILLLINPN